MLALIGAAVFAAGESAFAGGSLALGEIAVDTFAAATGIAADDAVDAFVDFLSVAPTLFADLPATALAAAGLPVALGAPFAAVVLAAGFVVVPPAVFAAAFFAAGAAAFLTPPAFDADFKALLMP